MTQNIEQQVQQIWFSFYEDPYFLNSSKTLEITQDSFIKHLEINEISVLKNYLPDGSLSYVSENIQKNLHLSRENLLKEGTHYILKNLIPEHSAYPVKIAGMIQKIFSTFSKEELKHLKLAVVGIRIRDNKDSTAMLNNSLPCSWDDNGLPISSINLLKNVTHLIKDNHYWIRIWTTHNLKKIEYFHSNGEELKLRGDILSKREKELLRLIMHGYSTEQISKTLYISPITVNNHRQSLLNKFSVKDTTALVILAKMVSFESW